MVRCKNIVVVKGGNPRAPAELKGFVPGGTAGYLPEGFFLLWIVSPFGQIEKAESRVSECTEQFGRSIGAAVSYDNNLIMLIGLLEN
jgi:hypothetical protein